MPVTIGICIPYHMTIETFIMGQHSRRPTNEKCTVDIICEINFNFWPELKK